jgi:hypothetical protein
MTHTVVAGVDIDVIEYRKCRYFIMPTVVIPMGYYKCGTSWYPVSPTVELLPPPLGNGNLANRKTRNMDRIYEVNWMADREI